MVKKIFGALGIIIGVLLLVVVGYFIYVFNAYYRLEDNLELAIETPLAESGEDVTMVNVNETYRIITHNVGFGAYTQDFSFFMDGGTESWAASEDSVKEVIASAAQFAYSYAPDFLFVQELDIDSTRSYHVDEYALYRSYFKEYYVNFAQNYDSPFLMYPLTQPHGASKAGIATFTKYAQNDAVRRSFPISTGLAKLVDLDRCYSVTRIPTNNGKYLVLYNLHMSAYGSDETVREGQISMLCADMATEYAVGNYIICGGDFNHNLTLAEDAETTQSWAAPFPRSALPDGLSFALDALSEEELSALQDSCRNADEPYEAGHTETFMLDGFIVSDNVDVSLYTVLGTEYTYSDHDPVYMEFSLIY